MPRDYQFSHHIDLLHRNRDPVGGSRFGPLPPMSAYMSTRRVKPPAAFSFLSFFPELSLVRPRRRLSPAPTAYCRRPARADAVKAGRFFSGHPSGPRPLQQSSTTAGLMGRGRLHSCCYLSVSRVSAHYSDNGCCFLAGLATKSMARAIIASTYIRQLRSGLPRCCLHGRSCRRDGTHL